MLDFARLRFIVRHAVASLHQTQRDLTGSAVAHLSERISATHATRIRKMARLREAVLQFHDSELAAQHAIDAANASAFSFDETSSHVGPGQFWRQRNTNSVDEDVAEPLLQSAAGPATVFATQPGLNRVSTSNDEMIMPTLPLSTWGSSLTLDLGLDDRFREDGTVPAHDFDTDDRHQLNELGL